MTGTPVPYLLPHLPARKRGVDAALIYRTLVRPSLRRSFNRIALSAPSGEQWPDLPLLCYSNHVSWWDGYLAFFLTRERWHLDSYLMMEEPQLRRYRFFQRCGCFSVDRHDPREGLRSVVYAAHLLHKRPGRVLWIFPQGEITPNDRRPIRTYAGAAHIARRTTPVCCVPVALRFEFFGEQRPDALVRIGPPHIVEDGDVKAIHAEMDRRLLDEVDGLRLDTLNGATKAYRTVMAGIPSVNVLWDRVRGKHLT